MLRKVSAVSPAFFLAGVPTYNEVREAYGLSRATSFADVTSNEEVQLLLEEAYGNDLDLLDAFTGALAEGSGDASNGFMGELLQVITIGRMVSTGVPWGREEDQGIPGSPIGCSDGFMPWMPVDSLDPSLYGCLPRNVSKLLFSLVATHACRPRGQTSCTGPSQATATIITTASASRMWSSLS